MKSKIVFLSALFFIAFATPKLVRAEAGPSVIINEITWMGTENSANDEWIELYSTEETDLTGWILKATDGSPEIILEGTIPANGYFLLERTDDNSVPNITADQIYTGALSNSGENLELRDNQNNLIDSVNSWSGGNNDTKQTMERSETGWQTSLNPGGTPKAQNSSGAEEETPEENTAEETATEKKSDTQEPTAQTSQNQPPAADAGPDITALTNQEIIFDASSCKDPDNDELTYFWNFGDGNTSSEKQTSHKYLYSGEYIVTLSVSDGKLSSLDIITANIYAGDIIISEFTPNPEGKDSDNEWIEIQNQGNQIANLSKWQLDDNEGGSKPFIFPENTLIAPNQFLVINVQTSKITLNNDKDTVRLFYPNGTLVMEVEYEGNKKEGVSVAFDGNDYFWTENPTPSTANIISLSKSEKEISLLDTSKKVQDNSEENKKLSLTENSKFSVLNSPIRTSDLISYYNPVSFKAAYAKSEDFSYNAETAQTSFLLNHSGSRNNFILAICIIISTSLLITWLLALIKKKMS